jgi:hypothetical protein
MPSTRSTSTSTITGCRYRSDFGPAFEEETDQRRSTPTGRELHISILRLTDPEVQSAIIQGITRMTNVSTNTTSVSFSF